jgi:sugar/nucleoside kinase (ribokinase family)
MLLWQAMFVLTYIPNSSLIKLMICQSFFLPGKLINVDEMVISPGGPVSNTGLNLKKLGMSVSVMGKIGNDFLGNGLIEILRKNGVDGLLVADNEITSYTVVVDELKHQDAKIKSDKWLHDKVKGVWTKKIL